MTHTLLLLAVAALPAANPMSLPEGLALATFQTAAGASAAPSPALSPAGASIDALLAHPALPPVTSNLPSKLPTPASRLGAASPDFTAGSGTPSPWGLAGGAALILALGVATLWMQKRKRGTTRHIQVVETASLGPKRSLALVVVGRQSMLLSCCDAGIFLVSSQPATAEMLQQADRSAAGVAAAGATDDDEGPRPLLRPVEIPRAAGGFAAQLAEAEETQGLRRRLSEAGVLR